MNKILGLVQGQPWKIEVEFKDESEKAYSKKVTVKAKGNDTEEVPLYTNKDNICGEIKITPTSTKRVEHQGIRVQLIGQIELLSEKGHYHDFVSLVRDLSPSGELATARTLPFEFRNVEMQYDSYRGGQVRCRYLLRVSISGKGMVPDQKKDVPFWVRNYEKLHEASAPIKMEVGIEECLHIEFEYDKAKYHLRDVVVGRIYFLLVRIKLKHMEIEIRRRETTGTGSSAHNETETLAKYEIMDGAPVRNETIPIRLYLSPYDLTPTYVNVHNKFSVRYFLNLVLVDEEDRRYFKQQEVTLYRKEADSGPYANGTPSAPPSMAPPPPSFLRLVPADLPEAPAAATAVAAAAAAPSVSAAEPAHEPEASPLAAPAAEPLAWGAPLAAPLVADLPVEPTPEAAAAEPEPQPAPAAPAAPPLVPDTPPLTFGDEGDAPATEKEGADS